MSTRPRILCWFSCGCPSAVAAKLTLQYYRDTHEVLVVNCDTRPSEHPDNYRFTADIEKWLGAPIAHIRNEDYADVDEVFVRTRYMAGVAGARCTTELKKVPRLQFARSDDWHVFGFTFDEAKRRVPNFRAHNPDVRVRFPLVEFLVTKADCVAIVTSAGIRQPAMYELGFDNNNCPGCVKASGPWYWDMVRTHFPEVFKRRCEQSRALGVRLVEIKHHTRIFLDELPPGPFKRPRKMESLSCGPECGVAVKMA